jgi:hypothetical protein
MNRNMSEIKKKIKEIGENKDIIRTSLEKVLDSKAKPESLVILKIHFSLKH